MNLLRDLWSVLTPRQRLGVLAGQILALVMAFATVTGIGSIAPFFAVLGDPEVIGRNRFLHALYGQFGFSSRRDFVVALGVGFIAMALLSNLINLLGSYALSRLAWWIGTDLQSALFAEYLNRPYPFHARTHSALLLNNVITETARATHEILHNGLMSVSNLISAVSILLAMLLLNPAIAVGMILALAGGYALIYLIVRNRVLRSGRIQSESFAEQARIAAESFGAIKEVLVLRIQDFFRASFERAGRAAAHAYVHTQQVAQSPKYVMECVAVAGLVGVALALSGGEHGIGPWLGQLTFAGFAAYRLLPTLQQGFAGLVKVRAARAGFATLAPDLRLARTRKSAGVAADRALLESPRQGIDLEDVSFRYAPDRPAGVDRVSLHIPARSAVGLVGVNGSGKTTLVDLIAGLLVPQAGRLQVDGIEVTDANRTAWRSRIAYVPQSIYLLDTTIAGNVALGIPTDSIDRERLLAAARLAQLDDFVRTLPDGYNHPVGERGVRLSGGQRQRIGIARALYTNASVLMLDEATNALDSLTEQELMATLMRLRGRYTIVLIAHRLSTLRACDAIFEIRNGQVAASGTYAELLRNSEAFQRMAAAG
jgi:ATP-binding cassette, subfamily B, bacterial PglK